MKQMYIATIQVLIPVQTEAEACDYVSETLRTAFPDWSYLQLGGQLCTPTACYVPDPYSEGSAFKQL